MFYFSCQIKVIDRFLLLFVTFFPTFHMISFVNLKDYIFLHIILYRIHSLFVSTLNSLYQTSSYQFTEQSLGNVFSSALSQYLYPVLSQTPVLTVTRLPLPSLNFYLSGTIELSSRLFTSQLLPGFLTRIVTRQKVREFGYDAYFSHVSVENVTYPVRVSVYKVFFNRIKEVCFRDISSMKNNRSQVSCPSPSQLYRKDSSVSGTKN